MQGPVCESDTEITITDLPILSSENNIINITNSIIFSIQIYYLLLSIQIKFHLKNCKGANSKLTANDHHHFIW